MAAAARLCGVLLYVVQRIKMTYPYFAVTRKGKQAAAVSLRSELSSTKDVAQVSCVKVKLEAEEQELSSLPLTAGNVQIRFTQHRCLHRP